MNVEAARIYEDLFVPALFGQFAPRIADAAQIRPGDTVLDVGCGTGALSRELQLRVAPSGRVIGIDPSQGMIQVARGLAPGIEFKRGVAESLDFPDEAFDAVVSQFSLMFFDDKVAAIQEMRRVLKPAGRMCVAVWESLDNIPAYVDVVALIDSVMGTGTGDALRAPFSLGDVAQLQALFELADVPHTTTAACAGAVRFDSIDTWLEADVKGWLPIAGPVAEAQFQEVLDQGKRRLLKYCAHDGSVEFPIHANLVSAIKPAADSPG